MIIENSSRYIFLDFEFNTVKKIQEIVSVGIVECTKNFNIISTHHYLVKLSMTEKMDRYASSVNKITDDMLVDAMDFKTVFLNLQDKLKLKESDKIYTWGIDDKKAFDKCIEYHNLKEELYIMSNIMTDIQKDISSKIKYKGKLLSEILSLKAVKEIYNIEGNVTHNALDDSIDLMNIFEKSLKNNINYKVVENIALKKIEDKNKNEAMKNTITDFSKKYPNGITLNSLDTFLFKKLNSLITSKCLTFSNSNIYDKTQDSFILKNEENKELQIKKEKVYKNIKINFQTKDNKIIIKFKSKNQLHEFHLNSRKNLGLSFAIIKRVEKNKKKL